MGKISPTIDQQEVESGSNKTALHDIPADTLFIFPRKFIR